MTHLRTFGLASIVALLVGCGSSSSNSVDSTVHGSAAGGGGRSSSEQRSGGAANVGVAGAGAPTGGHSPTLTEDAGGRAGASGFASTAGTNQTSGGTSFDTSSTGTNLAGGGTTASIVGGGGTDTFGGQGGIVGSATAGKAGSVSTSSNGISQTGGAFASGGVAGRGGISGISGMNIGGASNQGGVTSPSGSNTGSVLANCIIAGIGYPADRVNPADACQSCQPAVSVSTWSPLAEGASCGGRSYCQSGACVVGCMIGSKFYVQGGINPAMECEVCDSNRLQTTWSKVVGKSCGPELAAGDHHTCALISGGVSCWGSNTFRELGDGSTVTLSTVPVPVSSLTGSVTAIAAGGAQTCAIVSGAVRCWGTTGYTVTRSTSTFVSPTPTQVPGLESGVTAVAVGTNHACAVVDGAAKCWGSNDKGQLGTGDASDPDVPVQVKGLTANVTAIAAGVDFSCAAVKDSQVYCWGANNHYQLAAETYLTYRNPVSVSLPYGTIVALAAGDGHTCAILNGAAFCWGYNWRGQLGTNASSGISSKPTQVVDAGAGVTAIAAGFYHTCAIINDAAKCWGMNDSGELGTATAPAQSSTPAAPYGLIGTATSIATGHTHSCFSVNQEVYCAGTNGSGQLGTGNTTSSTSPVKVLLQ